MDFIGIHRPSGRVAVQNEAGIPWQPASGMRGMLIVRVHLLFSFMDHKVVLRGENVHL